MARITDDIFMRHIALGLCTVGWGHMRLWAGQKSFPRAKVIKRTDSKRMVTRNWYGGGVIYLRKKEVKPGMGGCELFS